jgi:hypothetical protein
MNPNTWLDTRVARLHLYHHGPQVGYIGWIEMDDHQVLAFVRTDGTFQIEW